MFNSIWSSACLCSVVSGLVLGVFSIIAGRLAQTGLCSVVLQDSWLGWLVFDSILQDGWPRLASVQ